MYKTSTYFIKAQIPGVTQKDLVDLYKRELEIQSVNNISADVNTISFINNFFRFIPTKSANKFSSFSQGKIEIVDEADEFGIYFQATTTRVFASAGLMAALAALLCLFNDGFNFFCLIVGAIVFVLLVIISFISTTISFPVYFTGLRNNIEEELRSAGH
ncbi:hypothetical protein [Ferruginibacter sp.]